MPHLRDSLIVAKVGIGEADLPRASPRPIRPGHPMPLHLKRYQTEGDLHFITFSCDQRRPYLTSPQSKALVLEAFEQTRSRYAVEIFGYVIMPEHIHLLLSEPPEKPLATALQSLKLSISKRSPQRPFWLPRYYDRNILSHDTAVEILTYMHQNPVNRGLVRIPQDWPWSSFRSLRLHEPSPVTLSPLPQLPRAPSLQQPYRR